MADRRIRTLALLVVLALLAMACGSDDDSDQADGGGGSTTDEVELPAEVDEAVAAATRYTDELGAEEAFAAVFVALDRGYDVTQLLEPDATLAPDGTIEGVDPEHEPYGATDATTDGTDDSEGDDSNDTGDRDEESLGAPEVELVALHYAPGQGDEDDDGDTSTSDDFDATRARITGFAFTLHEIWDDAEQQNEFDVLAQYLDDIARRTDPPASTDAGEINPRDTRILVGLLLLTLRGYSPEQIAAGFADGTIVGVPGAPACLSIEDQVPQPGSEALETYCDIVSAESDDSSTTEDDADDDRSDGGTSDGDGSDNGQSSSSGGTALEGIDPGTYQGTIDTSTGGFRDGVEITTADITLTVDDDGAAVDWTVEWTEPNEECTTEGTDWFSGDEVTQDTATSFSIRGNRAFRPGGDCQLGAEATDFERTFRFDVKGTTVTSDVGVGEATIDVG